LAEIKNYSQDSLNKKFVDIKSQIKELNKKLDLITSLKINKGDGYMKCFINDENVIGKWKYVCSTLSVENYEKNDTIVEKDAFLKELYFLPNGEGYWFIDRWTKGFIYEYDGRMMKYTIQDNLLFVECYNHDQEFEIILVFEKENSNKYSKSELAKQDDINMSFVNHPEAIGYWLAIDFIPFNDKNNYTPKNSDYKLFLKSLNITPNGDCFQEYENGEISKIKWTKDYILSTKSCIASNYIIKNINNEDYLIMDWKSGDYIYGGIIQGCYVFKKVK
jgi:hypothetical protein